MRKIIRGKPYEVIGENDLDLILNTRGKVLVQIGSNFKELNLFNSTESTSVSSEITEASVLSSINDLEFKASVLKDELELVTKQLNELKKNV